MSESVESLFSRLCLDDECHNNHEEHLWFDSFEAAVVKLVAEKDAALKRLEEMADDLNSANEAQYKTIGRQNAILTECRGALEECDRYFDDMADAEYFPDSAAPVPNKEMIVLGIVRKVLTNLKEK